MKPIIHKKKAFFYATGSETKIYPLEVNFYNLEADRLPYDYDKTLQACQDGCNSYQHNGGCPPYSPNYPLLSGQYTNALVLYYKLNLKDFPQRPETGTEYMRWTFTESFMPRLLLNSLVSLAKKLSGYVLSSGHCIGCRKCNFMRGETVCLKPDRRTYSLEAVGVNIEELMRQYSDSPIIWWQKGEERHIPEYQLRVGAVLHNHQLNEDDQEKLFDLIYRKNLRKYPS